MSNMSLSPEDIALPFLVLSSTHNNYNFYIYEEQLL